MIRLPNKLLPLLVSTPCLALACGPTPIAPAAAPGPSAAIVVVPTAATETASVVTPPACVEPPGPRPAVARLDDVWPDQHLFGTAADASAAVKKACDKIAARGAKAEKDGPGQRDWQTESIGRCYASAKGAWALDTSNAAQLSANQIHTSDGWEIHYKLTYVTPEGKLVTTGQIAGEVSNYDAEQHGADVLSVFDFDGDGASEILVRTWDSYGGEEHDENLTMLTFADGEVKEYAPAADLEITGVLDADADGRPDLVVPGPFHVIGPCGLDGQEFRAPSHLAHALPGGKFSLDDAVAQEAVRLQCGPLDKELVAVDRENGSTYLNTIESARRITCARIYGMSAKEAAGRVRGRYPYPVKDKDAEPASGDPGYCMSLKIMLELASQTPTFTTQPPCAAR